MGNSIKGSEKEESKFVIIAIEPNIRDIYHSAYIPLTNEQISVTFVPRKLLAAGVFN